MKPKESKHTPAPWHIANGTQIRGEKDQIAKVWMMRNGEGIANAQLIASAPELLEALKEARDYVELMMDSSGEDSGESKMLKRFDKAIARAESRS
jgi:hypothetical protein